MAREPNPRFRSDVRLVIDISAADQIEAEQRLEAVCDFLRGRLTKSTFARLAGQPSLDYVDIPSDVEPL